MAQLFAPRKRVIPKKEFKMPERYSSDEYYIHKKLVAYSLDKKKLVFAAKGLKGSYSIAKGTETINERAFADCKQIKEIIIPDSVTEIGEWAFASCSQLERVFIGKGVTHFPRSCFSDCKKLKKIVLLTENEITFGDMPFAGCTEVEKVVLAKGNGEIMKSHLPFYSQNKVAVFEVDTNDKKQVKEACEQKKTPVKNTESQPFTFRLDFGNEETLPFDVMLTESEEEKIRKFFAKNYQYTFAELEKDAPKLYAKINAEKQRCYSGEKPYTVVIPKGLTFSQGEKLDVNFIDAKNLHNFIVKTESTSDAGRFCFITTTNEKRAEKKSTKLFCFRHPQPFLKFELDECYISPVHPYLLEHADEFKRIQKLYEEAKPKLMEWKELSMMLSISITDLTNALDEYFDTTFQKLDNSVPENGIVKIDVNIEEIDKNNLYEHIYYSHGVAVVVTSDSSDKALQIAMDCIDKYYPSLPHVIEDVSHLNIDVANEYEYKYNLLGGVELAKKLNHPGYFFERTAKLFDRKQDSIEAYNKMVDVCNFIRELEHYKYKSKEPTFKKYNESNGD